MKVFVGIPSYNRAKIFQYCLKSFENSRLLKGFILVIDVTSYGEADLYHRLVKGLMDRGFEVIYDINIGRKGSTRARNLILDIAEANLSSKDTLLLYDDDYIYAGDKTVTPALCWLRVQSIGIIGGRVINLRRRKVDPDFALNRPYLAEAITKLTGFIVLNIEHGPRYVDYTTPLMAIKVGILRKGIRYDENYKGTGYREESDFQRQVRELGLKIVFEPRFYAYHLGVEIGGNRYSDLEDRMYWKQKNHTYFMNKWQYPVHKKILSYVILASYALLNGPPAIKGMIKAARSGR